MNVSSEPEGRGAGVLLRALEPLEGIALMQLRRGTHIIRDLCRGPGRLCQAMAIDRSLNELDLLQQNVLYLAAPIRKTARVRKSKRIGISKAPDRLLRFYESGSSFVSGPRSLSP
jgi:DNA-3-methyladenine glycosylase